MLESVNGNGFLFMRGLIRFFFFLYHGLDAVLKCGSFNLNVFEFNIEGF